MIDASKLQLWIKHAFDHPASGPQWYFDIYAPRWQGNGDDVPELIAGESSPSGWTSVESSI